MASESIILTKKSGKKEIFAPQTSTPRPLWWIIPDVERTQVPVTCQFRPEHSDQFTPDRQRFVMSLNRSGNTKRDNQAFQGYRDIFNTRGKVRDHWNEALQEQGSEPGMPTLEFNIGFRANVVSGIPMVSNGKIGIPEGEEVLQLETININNLLPYGITYRTHPWLVHHEVICLYEKRNPVPQMGGKDISPYLPSYTPLWSKVKMYMRMSELKPVPFGAVIPNPYEPEWGEPLYHDFVL